MGGVSLGRASHQEGGTRDPRSPTPAWLQGPSPGKVLPAAGGTCEGPQAWLPEPCCLGPQGGFTCGWNCHWKQPFRDPVGPACVAATLAPGLGVHVAGHAQG